MKTYDVVVWLKSFLLFIIIIIIIIIIIMFSYSITSMARTRMARLPWMIRTLFSVPTKFFQ